MGSRRVVERTERKNAIHHLYQAVEANTAPRKDFHVRRALRLLGITDRED